MSNQPILILGAGIGGLSAAIHLAASGHNVTVLEQNPAVGGKMSEIAAEGFRFDTGPSVITMRPVFEDLFRAANRRLEDYLTLLPVEPLTRYFWPDGSKIDLSRDLPKTAAQISALEPRDLEGYLDFLAEAARLHRITGPVFTYGPPPSLESLKHVTLKDALSVDVVRSLQAKHRAPHPPPAPAPTARAFRHLRRRESVSRPGHPGRHRPRRTDRGRLVSAGRHLRHRPRL
jgi:phytoene dehydrogenase-like protein